jgi:RNA polymerase sigma factor FliA
MMIGCELRRPVDPPAVLLRVRDGLLLVDMICHQVRKQLGVATRMEDLVSYGREGLLAAARSFDPKRGVPFRRWANIRVRGAVIDGIRAQSWLPRSVYARIREMESDASRRDGTLEEEWTQTDRAEAADRRLGEYLAGAATAIALGFAGGVAGENGEPTDRTPSAEQRLLDGELWRAIRHAVTELPDAERTLMQRHYFDGVTFEQAALELGLSKSWASRLHTRAVEAVTRSLKRSCWV